MLSKKRQPTLMSARFFIIFPCKNDSITFSRPAFEYLALLSKFTARTRRHSNMLPLAATVFGNEKEEKKIKEKERKRGGGGHSLKFIQLNNNTCTKKDAKACKPSHRLFSA